ncbi:ThiF family adenylyltransferase [Patescibacteria group bacterium]|nr:ThiF family adenylyltransferase [Patescibacteria group bacterium]
MNIKIHDGVSVIYRPLRNKTYEVNFLFKVSGRILTLRLNHPAFLILKMLDGTHAFKEIAEVNGISAQEVRKLMKILSQHRLVDINHQKSGKHETDGRFKNQLNFFADYETKNLSRQDMQDQLNRSKVAVIGLGGIGSWVVYGLALAGIKNFILIDPDKISLSNLSRQALYGIADTGKFKVDVMRSRLALLDQTTDCRIIKRTVKSPANVSNFTFKADLVINCADNPATDQVNRWVTDACYSAGQPHILCGGYDGHLSFLGPTVIPDKSACWYCYEKSLDARLAAYRHLQITESEIEGGSLGSISAITANFHVLEAVKVLTGFSKPLLRNAVAEIDFHRFQLNLKRFRKHHSCKICNGGKNGR